MSLPEKPKLSKLKKEQLLEFIKENNISIEGYIGNNADGTLSARQCRDIIKNEYILERRNAITKQFEDSNLDSNINQDSMNVVVVWDDFPKFSVDILPYNTIYQLKTIISLALAKKVALNPFLPGFVGLVAAEISIIGHDNDFETLHFVCEEGFDYIRISRNKNTSTTKFSILVVGEDVNKPLYFAHTPDQLIRYIGGPSYIDIDDALAMDMRSGIFSRRYREIYICDKKYYDYISRLISVLDSTTQRSKIYLLDNEEEIFRKKYNILPTSKKIMNVGDTKVKFYGYMYIGNIVDTNNASEEVIVQNSGESNIFIPCSTAEEVRTLKPKIVRNYTFIPDIQGVDLNNPTQFEPITVSDFRKLLDDKEFIEQYTASVNKLVRDKKTFYKNKYEDAKKNYELCQRKTMNAASKNIRVNGEDSMIKIYGGIMTSLSDKMGMLKEFDTSNIASDIIDAIENPEFGLASMYGREDIKNDICAGLYAFAKRYEYIRTTFMLNYVIMGPAGCGKTMLAQVIAYVLKRSGILASGHLVMLTRGQTIGKYVGHTAPQTLEIMYNSLEGVLFIDEAHTLSKPDTADSKDFGPEAVSEIVNFEDKFIGGTHSTILAGYEKEMRRNTLSSNQGLNRRFPNQFVLEKYSLETMTDILLSFIERGTGLNINENDSNYIYSLLSGIPDKYLQNQSGDMLTLGAYITKIISASYIMRWDDENNHHFLLRCGFEKFLKMKSKTL